MTAAACGLLAVTLGTVSISGFAGIHEAAAEATAATLAEATPPPSVLQTAAKAWATDHWGAPLGVKATVTVASVICAKTFVESTWPEETTSSRAWTEFDVVITTDPTTGAPAYVYAAESTSPDPLCTPQEKTPAWILGLMDDMHNEKESK
ncbi:hypothetical protein SAMN05216368_10923 [Cryobacterium flavum]|nr:hypothetical protein SAMN05216368_10923 [Cryobacterium flavum]